VKIRNPLSMTPHAPCMQCQWHRVHFKKFEYLREFEFIFCRFKQGLQKKHPPTPHMAVQGVGGELDLFIL
jgi:hypothetical protein